MLAGDEFPSMTPECPQVHLFEREIAEQWGVVPKGHPWLKPVRFHPSYRPGHDAWGRAGGVAPVVGVTDFYRVEGEEIHEVAVGPVHAGVIEPGHFRFQCHGEHVFHLEISLGYQHRGVERALVGGPDKRTIHYMETLAGDTTIGHATAYCQILEALGGAQVPPRAAALRGVALELERLANHTGDLGALAGDVGFLPTASYCGRLRGDFLNMTALALRQPLRSQPGAARRRRLRRGRGAGGRAAQTARRRRAEDLANAVRLLWDTPSVMARFEDTGRVQPDLADELGLVGPAARASGLRRDVRKTHPTGIFRFVHIPISTWSPATCSRAPTCAGWRSSGRSTSSEHRSVSFRAARYAANARRPDRSTSRSRWSKGGAARSATSRSTDQSGRFSTYKVVDPSFHNWMGLAMALRDQQISDFPLCNKSFNLSYCGHDL